MSEPPGSDKEVCRDPADRELTPQGLLRFVLAYVQWSRTNCRHCNNGDGCRLKHTEGRCHAAALYFGVHSSTVTRHWSQLRAEKHLGRRTFRDWFEDGDELPADLDRFFSEFFRSNAESCTNSSPI